MHPPFSAMWMALFFYTSTVKWEKSFKGTLYENSRPPQQDLVSAWLIESDDSMNIF